MLYNMKALPLISILVTMLLVLFIIHGFAQENSASITSISGSVNRYLHKQALWEKANQGDKLLPGDMIKTGQDGSVEISFPDGSKIYLKENTDFSIELSQEKAEDGTLKSVMNLDLGKLRATIEKLKPPGSTFKIKTPTSVAAVRGTDLFMNVDFLKDQPTEKFTDLFVDDGDVFFSDLKEEFGEMIGAKQESRGFMDGNILEPQIAPQEKQKQWKESFKESKKDDAKKDKEDKKKKAKKKKKKEKKKADKKSQKQKKAKKTLPKATQKGQKTVKNLPTGGGDAGAKNDITDSKNAQQTLSNRASDNKTNEQNKEGTERRDDPTAKETRTSDSSLISALKSESNDAKNQAGSYADDAGTYSSNASSKADDVVASNRTSYKNDASSAASDARTNANKASDEYNKFSSSTTLDQAKTYASNTNDYRDSSKSERDAALSAFNNVNSLYNSERDDLREDLTEIIGDISLAQLDDKLEQTEDHRTGKVITDIHGYRVRVDQYVLRPTDKSAQIIGLNLRAGGDSKGITSSDFNIAFNSNLPSSSTDFRNLPWGDYFMLEYDSHPSLYPTNYSLELKNPHGDTLKASGDFTTPYNESGTSYIIQDETNTSLKLNNVEKWHLEVTSETDNTQDTDPSLPLDEFSETYADGTFFSLEFYLINDSGVAQLDLDDLGFEDDDDGYVGGGSGDDDDDDGIFFDLGDIFQPRKYNLEMVFKASEFNGRTIDIIFAPEIVEPYDTDSNNERWER